MQYASATGTGSFGANAGQLVALPAIELAPGQYFLLQLAGGSNGEPLPTPDATGTINMAGASGKVALVDGTDGLGCNGGSTPCSDAQLARILDLVGYGSANFFEGTAAAPTLSNTTAGFRRADGCVDTNDNAADFVTGAPTPRNTSSPLSPCDQEPGDPVDPIEPEPEEPLSARIHEIQGDGLGSPLLGSLVVTEGIVTARRSIGYFIQSAPGEDLAPDMFVGRLGRYQGMRVSVQAARVTGPTNRFGDFYITLPDVPRPFREPGIAVLDTVPIPPGLSIPSWDRNPERLRVESTGLADGTPLFVDVGYVVENLTGVMYFDRDDFTLLLGELPDLEIARRGLIPAALPPSAHDEISIVSFNIENLSGGANVPATRRDKLSQVFCTFLDTPDVVGLIEIANLATLERLATAINDDEFGHCPRSPEYQAHLLSGSGSQRLGYLVSTRETSAGEPRVDVVTVTELALDELLMAPDGSTNSGPLFDRPPLLLQAHVYGPNAQRQPINVLLTHSLSLLAARNLASRTDAWETQGNRSRGKRLAQALRLAELSSTVQLQAPDKPYFLIGDFNAFEFSDGYVDVLGIVSGDRAPADEVLVHGESPLSTPLHNLTFTLPEALRYSYVFQGSAQNLDHMLVNDAVFDVGAVEFSPVRLNSDFAADNAETEVVPMGTSDHDPLALRLAVDRFNVASFTWRVIGRPVWWPIRR